MKSSKRTKDFYFHLQHKHVVSNIPYPSTFKVEEFHTIIVQFRDHRIEYKLLTNIQINDIIY